MHEKTSVSLHHSRRQRSIFDPSTLRKNPNVLASASHIVGRRDRHLRVHSLELQFSSKELLVENLFSSLDQAGTGGPKQDDFSLQTRSETRQRGSPEPMLSACS